MKLYLFSLYVFKLILFSHCENVTNSAQNSSAPIRANNLSPKVKFSHVEFSPQNKSIVSLKSVEIISDFDVPLNESLEDIKTLLGDKSKEFEWKDPQFKAFQFGPKDNSTLEKLLDILTPLINLTRLENATKEFEWSDEELGGENLLSGEDEDLGFLNFQVGTFIQKISLNPNPNSPNSIEDSKSQKEDVSLERGPDENIRVLNPQLGTTQKISPEPKPKLVDQPSKVQWKEMPKTITLTSKQTAGSRNSNLTLKHTSDPKNSTSEVASEGFGQQSASAALVQHRLPRDASDRRTLDRLDGIPEPYISRQFSVNTLTELMDYYEPLRLPGLPELNISLACQKDMQLYIEALNKRLPWAMKMMDASGHYGGSFFNGNTYWLGSRTLCSRISRYPTRVPFRMGFYTARADFNFASLEPKERRQFVGVCLPHSCLGDDVTQLLEHSSQEAPSSSERSVAISHVRTPHSYYHMARDPLVLSLVIITAVVLVLLAIGTGLDIYLSLEDKCNLVKNKKIYDSYNYAVSHVGLPSNEMKMGASGLDSPNSGTVIESSETHDLVTELLLSFSVIRNMRQICDQSVGIDTIPVVHGFRALSMAWVILGHTCIIAFKYSDNMEYRLIVQEELVFQVVNNATFSVDTFFFISGLLVSFLYFRTISKIDVTLITKATGFASGCLEFVGLICYRFLRLTTPYLYVLLVNLVCMRYFYHNSVFEPPADDHINCERFWWRNILYINTMYPQKDMCMLWSWYLADDTQFYILSLVLLITAVKYFKATAATLGFFLVMSWATTWFIAYSNNHMPNYDDPLSLFDKIYDKPWTRLGPYLIGISVGWILYKTDCNIKMSKLTVVTGWFLSAFSLLVMVFGVYGSSLHPFVAAGYSALSHSLWALSLAFIVIACSTGYGGYINTLLSAKCLYPFSRVTYCAYLVHPIVMRGMVMIRDSPLHLGKDIVITLFIGQLVVSYLISFVVSLAFEAPMVTMLKIISPTKRRRRL